METYWKRYKSDCADGVWRNRTCHSPLPEHADVRTLKKKECVGEWVPGKPKYWRGYCRGAYKTSAEDKPVNAWRATVRDTDVPAISPDGEQANKHAKQRLLSPDGWLNDDVITAYMNLINRSRDHVYCYHANFYEWYVNRDKKNPNTTKRLQEQNRKRIENKQLVMLPVNVSGNHWILAVINFRYKKPRVLVYDSLKTTVSQKRADEIAGTLSCLVSSRVQDTLRAYIMNGPKQANFSDCGVFVCVTAEYIARGARLTFGSSNMPFLRYKIFVELMHGKLENE